MEKFINSFITIFLAIDPIGIVPTYIALGFAGSKEKLRISIIYAFFGGLLFIVVGKSILSIVGITLDDLKIAGGILLIALSIKELLSSTSYYSESDYTDSDPIVPLTVPLIVGPATLTALLVSSELYGYIATFVSFTLNLFVCYGILSYSGWIIKIMGERGVKGISKVTLLLLTAFGVSFIRRGIEGILTNRYR